MTDAVFIALIVFGMAGAVVFLVDYLRLASSSSVWAKHTIVLNSLTISVLLFLALMRMDFGVDADLFKGIAITLVAVLLWLQIPLLHLAKSQAKEEQNNHDELDGD